MSCTFDSYSETPCGLCSPEGTRSLVMDKRYVTDGGPQLTSMMEKCHVTHRGP